jgi:hypothetical protein
VEIGRSNDKVEVGGLLIAHLVTLDVRKMKIRTHLVGIECQRVRSSLRTTPEGLTFLRDRILGQTEQQLTDRIAEFVLELQTSPNDTFFER